MTFTKEGNVGGVSPEDSPSEKILIPPSVEQVKLRSHIIHLVYPCQGQTYSIQANQVLESNINPYEPVPSIVEVAYNGRVFAKIQFDASKNANKETLFFEENLAPAGMTFKSLVSFLKTWAF